MKTSKPTPDSCPRGRLPERAIAAIGAFGGLTAGACLLLTGCAAKPLAIQESVASFRGGEEETLRLDTGNGYTSAWAEMFPNAVPKDVGVTRLTMPWSQSRIISDFQSAATSNNLAVAQLRWANFLRKYVLAGGEYEDGTAAHLCEWSRTELERCKVLAAGKQNEATKLERELRSLAKQLGAKVVR